MGGGEYKSTLRHPSFVA